MYKLKEEFKDIEITVCNAKNEKYNLNDATQEQLEEAFKSGLEKYIEKENKSFEIKSKKNNKK